MVSLAGERLAAGARVTRYVLLGLSIGGLYALGALGIVAIYRGSKVLNLAHGAIAMWGAYLFVELRDTNGWDAWLAVVTTLAIAAGFGVLAYLLVVRPIRSATPLAKMVATIGMLGVLQALAADRFGVDTALITSSLPIEPVDVLGAFIGQDRLIILGIATVMTAILAFWSSHARVALATRAMTEHEQAATSLGYSPHVLGMVNWAIGCALAALAGLLLAPLTGLGPQGISIIVVPSLAAALVGRFESYSLALAGGLLLGVGESLVTKEVSAPGWSAAVPFLVVIAVLVFQRPKGANRPERQVAIPVSTGRLNPWLAGAAPVAVLALILLGSDQWVDATTISICFAILALSLVVLIGYANQISLAQMAIAGVGAYAAGRLALELDVPFVLAPVVGAAAAAIFGFLVGLPALRVRGINLAVVTIGLSLATERVLFQNPEYTGGFNGFRPPTPEVFGIRIDAIAHPAAYAVFCLLWLTISAVVVVIIRRSALGRGLLAMRTNERAAAAQGVSVARSKLIAFSISSALAGVAGVLLAFRQQQLTFTTFSFFESINVVTVAVVGGVGSILGGLLGGLVYSGGILFQGIQVLDLTWLEDNYLLVFGVLLIVAIQHFPNGIASLFSRHRVDPARIPEETVPARAPQPLDAIDLAVVFGGVRAVDGVSVTVASGRIVGLIGPNGAGKTTFLDAVGGFARARSGRVTLGTVEISHAKPHLRARAGMGRVFQAVELFEDLSVAQNLLVASESAGRARGRLPPHAHAMLARFGLDEELTRHPSDLSMARRRLIGLARALAGNPSVLLLDEPGAGLSLTESLELGEELRALAAEAGIGMLVVDHDMSLVMSACDEIVVLCDGKVLAVGSPDVISRDPLVRSAYLGETVSWRTSDTQR